MFQVWSNFRNQKILRAFFSGTAGKFFKILGFLIHRFIRTIELHYHSDIFFLCVFPRLQNAKFENVGILKFSPVFDLLGY